MENQAFANNCPISIAEIAGVRDQWVTCLATRVHSESDTRSTNIINGDDFVTVHNASGSSKFEMKSVRSILERFRPDFAMVPFDEHPIPISGKRMKKAVDRTLKYDKVFAEVGAALDIPFLSSAIGADNTFERARSTASVDETSAGFAFSDLGSFDVFKKIELIKSSSLTEESFRVIRASVSPVEMISLLPFVDAFDISFVDDLTAKGLALQITIPEGKLDAQGLIATASAETINLWDEKYFDDHSPMLDGCLCSSCCNYKRSYVHHLLKSHEMLAGVLLMMHNLSQYSRWLEYLKNTY